MSVLLKCFGGECLRLVDFGEAATCSWVRGRGDQEQALSGQAERQQGASAGGAHQRAGRISGRAHQRAQRGGGGRISAEAGSGLEVAPEAGSRQHLRSASLRDLYVTFMAGITRGGAWAGRRVASCVLGEGANELAEASIIATTKVRIMMMATAQPATAANLDVSLSFASEFWR